MSIGDALAFSALPRSKNTAPCIAGPVVQTAMISAEVLTLDDKWICEMADTIAASKLNGKENTRYIATTGSSMLICIRS